MKNVLVSFVILGVTGCATCHQQAAPAGIPMAGMSVAPQSAGTATEACPAIGWRWETVSFSIPKPKLFAVPIPQAGPQVVGIPILTGGPAMTMGAAPMMAAQPQMMAQPQYVQVQPQSQPSPAVQYVPQGEPQSTPCSTCQPGCAEGCTSQSQVLDECDALIRDISNLQQELCIETGKASIRARQ